MRSRGDPLGRILVRMGVVDDDAVADALLHRSELLRLASACYVLGHADEESLARGLSKQIGVPAVVLDRSIIRLSVLEGVPRELATRINVLPVYEDAERILVAVDDPEAARDALHELEQLRGKPVLPHVALRVTLARAIRASFNALARGQRFWAGVEADAGAATEQGSLVVVSDVDGMDLYTSALPDALVEDVTKEVDIDLLPIDDLADGRPRDWSGQRPLPDDGSVDTHGDTAGGGGSVDVSGDISVDSVASPSSTMGGRITPVSVLGLPSESQTSISVIDLDEDTENDTIRQARRDGPARVLFDADDFATRHLLVKELQPLGYVTTTASTGGEAVRALRANPPDLVVIDVMLPEIDGFQVCRAIKDSRRFSHVPVVLMSAVIDSGRLTADVLHRYGADAYFEKPLNTDRVKHRIKGLLAARGQEQPAPRDDSFERAIALYKDGRVDQAMDVLRDGLRADPMSAKHHFVLANLLQKRSMIYDAIDEYEATVDLKPDYFPALTRLAYLYYKQGYAAKAIETWRKSLPLCADANLRQNIELFMRKLIAEMQSRAG